MVTTKNCFRRSVVNILRREKCNHIQYLKQKKRGHKKQKKCLIYKYVNCEICFFFNEKLVTLKLTFIFFFYNTYYTLTSWRFHFNRSLFPRRNILFNFTLLKNNTVTLYSIIRSWGGLVFVFKYMISTLKYRSFCLLCCCYFQQWDWRCRSALEGRPGHSCPGGPVDMVTTLWALSLPSSVRPSILSL